MMPAAEFLVSLPRAVDQLLYRSPLFRKVCHRKLTPACALRGKGRKVGSAQHRVNQGREKTRLAGGRIREEMENSAEKEVGARRG